MLPLNQAHREDVERIRDQLWTYYADLKDYKEHPDNNKKKRSLTALFAPLFIQKTHYQILNQLLKRIHQNKAELLLVFNRPNIPLHTNGS